MTEPSDYKVDKSLAKIQPLENRSMKIVSYNINSHSAFDAQAKIDVIIQRKPADVWIISEAFEHTAIPEGWHYYWRGEDGIKGLGVIIRSGLKSERIETAFPLLNYCIPLFVDGLLIVGMWPTKYAETSHLSYPYILKSNIDNLRNYLENNPAIIAGDFNCYVGQSGERKQYNIKDISECLKQMNFESAYHSTTLEELGKESQGTLNFQYKGTKSFHIDYAFANVPIKSFNVAKWNGTDWHDAPIVSDHSPLSIEV